MVFGNQQGGTEPGIQITIQNDAAGSPQITFSAWDASSNPIVVATYDFSSWTNWVNLLVSINTATQQLQVWANSLISEHLVESELTPTAINWNSSNPIGALGTPWALSVTA